MKNEVADIEILFLTTFQDRNFYNAPVHNTAAALAGHYFFQSLEKKEAPERDTVVFITGIPGAGKTSAISSNKTELLTKYKLVFEE